MPVYKDGNCQFFGAHSEYLLPKVGFDRTEGKIIIGWACPECRKYLEEKVGDK